MTHFKIRSLLTKSNLLKSSDTRQLHKNLFAVLSLIFLIAASNFTASAKINRTNLFNQSGTETSSAILFRDFADNWMTANAPRLNSNEQVRQSEQNEQSVASVTVTAPLLQPVSPNTNFTVNLMTTNTTGEGILGYQFDLIYDQTVIFPVGNSCDTSGTISSGLFPTCNVSTPGIIRVVLFGTVPINGSGILLKLNFNAIGNVGQISPLTFQILVVN